MARAFTSVDGIAKALRPEYELREAVEPFVGQLISDEYSSQAVEKRDELVKDLKKLFTTGEMDGMVISTRDTALLGAGLVAGAAIAQCV